jgi:hypothetical protein
LTHLHQAFALKPARQHVGETAAVEAEAELIQAAQRLLAAGIVM